MNARGGKMAPSKGGPMKMPGGWILGFLLGIAVSLAACAGGPRYSVHPDYKSAAPRSVAVLPVLNETVNLKAPEVFRPILQNKLSLKGYESPPIVFIDGKLLEKEIREAGQINTLTPQELGKLLGVDALLYTTVTEFSTTYLLTYGSMTVGARFELMSAKTGERLWESEHQVKKRKLATDTKSMEETAKFAVLQSYTPLVRQVVNASFAALPDGPRAAAGPAQTGRRRPGGTK
jgi:hypothetical protein